MSSRNKSSFVQHEVNDAQSPDEGSEAEALSLTLVEDVMPSETGTSTALCEAGCELPLWENPEGFDDANASKQSTAHPAHKYNHCGVCNSELGFTHLTHFEYNTVMEEAFCYVCQNKAKKQNHSLQ